jgi:VanZ family protein
MSRRWLIGILAVGLYWMVGYYPIQWSPSSHFRLTVDGKGLQYIKTEFVENDQVRSSPAGLRFAAPGIAYLSKPPPWLPAVIEESSLNIRLKVRPLVRWQFGPARILTISRDPWERNLTIGQEGSNVIIRVRTPNTDRNGNPPYEIENVFSTTDTTHIGLHIGDGRIRVHINEKEALSAAIPSNALSGWSAEYKLAVGNELTFDRPWLGEIIQATLRPAGSGTDVSLIGALRSPNPYGIEHARHLEFVPFVRASSTDRDPYSDWLVNVLGFLPLGALVVGLRGRFAGLLAATLMCAGVSLSIEVGQFFLGERTPSIEDLVLNSTGGLLGAWMGHRSVLVGKLSRYLDGWRAPR